MKPVILLGWACLAFIFMTAPNANAQESKKNDSKDSIINAMSKLSLEMSKKALKFSLSADILNDRKRQNFNREIDSLGKEIEKMGLALEKEINRNGTDSAFSLNENQGDNNTDKTEAEVKDTTKNKAISIDEDGIHIRTGKNKSKPKNVVRKPKNSATDWILFDLGINVFTSKGSFDLPASADPLELHTSKSINSTLHIFRTGVNIYRHKIYTTFGLTYDMHDYRFNKGTTLQADTNQFAYYESPYKLEKNKLSAQYLTIPVMLHFETNPMKPSQSFKLGFGGWGGFLVNSYTKQKSESRGKHHLHDNFNLNTLNYGVRGQIGYGMFTVYSQYSVSPLFRKNAGAPELNPITFGVTLSGFKWN